MSDALKIAALNDAFRRTGEGGRTVFTAGVSNLGVEFSHLAFARVRAFAAFTPDNDPHGEHDFGSFGTAGAEAILEDRLLRQGAEVRVGRSDRPRTDHARPDPHAGGGILIMENAYVARQLLADMRRLTGHDYRIDLAKLNAVELREMQRFLRDAESASQNRARRAQLTPWKRP
jgi:hypothetical protein